MKRNLLTLCFFSIACAALYAGDSQLPADGTSPVPEPGSIILLGTAAAGIGYAAWRKRKK
ncbi:MAG: PEP-CTERM sorting domain-containing protein [Candidatus Solibacter usitatus]|nr:PEP-CTERM sorting domain-containing protein [Candidatus Solibacter usitatus]